MLSGLHIGDWNQQQWIFRKQHQRLSAVLKSPVVIPEVEATAGRDLVRLGEKSGLRELLHEGLGSCPHLLGRSRFE
jgi:hypothetical protein